MIAINADTTSSIAATFRLLLPLTSVKKPPIFTFKEFRPYKVLG